MTERTGQFVASHFRAAGQVLALRLSRTLVDTAINEAPERAAEVHRRAGRYGVAVDLLADAKDWDGSSRCDARRRGRHRSHGCPR